MRVAIIGFGQAGQAHYRRYQLLAIDVLVIDICAKQRALAKSMGLSAYASLQDGMSAVKNDIQLIDICTPTWLHYAHLIEAMGYQKPILVETPLVCCNTEAEWLRTRYYSPPVFVCEPWYYYPNLPAIFDDVSSLSLVAVRREINLSFTSGGKKHGDADETKSGGMLFNGMVHDISMLVCLFGKPREYQIIRADQHEVSTELDFTNTRVTLSCAWNGHQHASVTLRLSNHRRDGQSQRVLLKDAVLFDPSNPEDPLTLMLREFVQSAGTAPRYSYKKYLQAVQVTHDIVTACEKVRTNAVSVFSFFACFPCCGRQDNGHEEKPLLGERNGL